MFVSERKVFKELIELESQSASRHEFHARSKEILCRMAKDIDLLDEVVRFNFDDPAFLKREWSLYNIPNFYIGETEDFILKYHVFVPLQNHIPGSAASTIHHHSNYLLTTTAMLGSGYETFIFQKLKENERNLVDIPLQIGKHLTEEANKQSFVDSWQPHLVFNPSKLSATLIMWSADKKCVTDGLRQNKILKRFKGPLRKMIAAMGLENSFGITAHTLQYYVEDGAFVSIDEDEFFEPTRNALGPEVNSYTIQAIFAFLQRMGWKNIDYLEGMLSRPDVPKYFHPFVNMILNDLHIADVHAKEIINIPRGGFMKDEVLEAHQKVWEAPFE